jgi:regulator of sigma E protease
LTIASMADQSVRAGLKSFVALLAMLSLSLGVMNLLPIPVLDGGHLLYYLIEAVTGKAVSLRIQEYGFKLGLFLIIALMLLAFYNDFMRL